MNFLPQNSYFYHPSSFEHEIIFKESLVTYYDEPGCVGRFSEETHVSRTIVTAKMKLLVALVSSF